MEGRGEEATPQQAAAQRTNPVGGTNSPAPQRTHTHSPHHRSPGASLKPRMRAIAVHQPQAGGGGGRAPTNLSSRRVAHSNPGMRKPRIQRRGLAASEKKCSRAGQGSKMVPLHTGLLTPAFTVPVLPRLAIQPAPTPTPPLHLPCQRPAITDLKYCHAYAYCRMHK